MVSINVNLKRRKKGFECTFSLEEEGKVLHEQRFEDIDLSNVYIKRAKEIGIGDKKLAVVLNIFKTPSKKEIKEIYDKQKEEQEEAKKAKKGKKKK